MSTIKTLVEFEHDTGYGDQLLEHINAAIRGKDMVARRVIPEIEHETCQWEKRIHPTTFDTSCDPDGKPILGIQTDDFKFCPKCGSRIELVAMADCCGRRESDCDCGRYGLGCS